MSLNILYFVCHDLGRALGCYGADLPTPFLDRFAKEGIRFSNAHCASPACSPSRACAMSGLYAHTSGAIGLSHMGWPLALEHSTIVDDANQAGYETILSGLNHERHPRTDRYQVDLAQSWEDWQAERAVDRLLEVLRQRDHSRPFYANVATQEPHACTWKSVGTRIPPLSPSGSVWMPPGMPRTPALELAFLRFAAAVAYVDRAFGKLLQGLDDLNLRDSTLVIFTTDHGMSGPRGKGSLYGLGTEIALLMSGPGLEGGQVVKAPVSNLGLRATIAEAAAIPLSSPVQGASFLPLLYQGRLPEEPILYLERNFHGEKPWRTEDSYIDLFDPMRAIRSEKYLYIRNFQPEAKPAEPGIDIRPRPGLDWSAWAESWELVRGNRPGEELYDLETDPLEYTNLAGTASGLEICRQHRLQLHEWMSRTADFLPGPPPARPERPGWGPHWSL